VATESMVRCTTSIYSFTSCHTPFSATPKP
jgi:hypothetical protein